MTDVVGALETLLDRLSIEIDENHFHFHETQRFIGRVLNKSADHADFISNIIFAADNSDA